MKSETLFESEYHSDFELNKIKNWDYRNVFELIEHIQDMWNWKQDYFVSKWGKRKFDNADVLLLELHTGGWSGNEDIIAALEEHEMFFNLWHTKWERGGHYYFEIEPKGFGYKVVYFISL